MVTHWLKETDLVILMVTHLVILKHLD